MSLASRLFRVDQSGLGVVLGPLENKIMDALWSIGRAAKTAEIQAALRRSDQALSYSAIKAVLNNLADKDWVIKSRKGNVTFFAPVHTRAEAEQAVVSSVIASLRRNFNQPLIAEFCEQLADDDAAIDELERLISDRRNRKST